MSNLGWFFGTMHYWTQEADKQRNKLSSKPSKRAASSGDNEDDAKDTDGKRRIKQPKSVDTWYL